jgi:hypothetical protein
VAFAIAPVMLQVQHGRQPSVMETRRADEG